MFKAASKRVLVRAKVGAWKVDENILKNWKILTGKLATPTNSSIVIYKLGNVATEISIYLTSLTVECRIVSLPAGFSLLW